MNSVPAVSAPPSPMRTPEARRAGAGAEGGQRRGEVWLWRPLNQRRQPYRTRSLAADPYRRLLAAIVCQAVIDVVNPQTGAFKPSPHDRYTAQRFLLENRQILIELDIPYHKVDFLTDWIAAQHSPEVAA